MEATRQEKIDPAEPDIKRLALELHTARVAADKAMTAVIAGRNAARDAWEREHPELVEASTEAALAQESCNTVLRTALVEQYYRTQEKSFEAGCGVRVSEVYNYPDDKALAWAKENARVAVLPECLNVKTFEGFCKDEKLRPTFVEVTEKATASVPVDLTKYFPESEV